MRGLQEDPARTAELLKTLEAKLKGYEAILSKQKYLAGDVCAQCPKFPRKQEMLIMHHQYTGSDPCGLVPPPLRTHPHGVARYQAIDVTGDSERCKVRVVHYLMV